MNINLQRWQMRQSWGTTWRILGKEEETDLLEIKFPVRWFGIQSKYFYRISPNLDLYSVCECLKAFWMTSVLSLQLPCSSMGFTTVRVRVLLRLTLFLSKTRSHWGPNTMRVLDPDSQGLLCFSAGLQLPCWYRVRTGNNLLKHQKLSNSTEYNSGGW